MTWYKKITVEVPLLLCFFSFLLMGSIMTNLVYYRTCYNILGYDESLCNELGKSTDRQDIKDLEKKVQKSANIIVMVLEMPPALIPVLINVFAGAWSDRYGRKPVLLTVIAGLFVSVGMFGALICIRNLSPWAFLIATIPSMLTGSLPTYLTVTLAYLNDISTPETRGIRMAVFEAVMVTGMFFGTLSSSYLLYATSYETCFFFATGLIGLSLLYTIFCIPESLPLKKRQEQNGRNIQSICQCRNFTDNFKAVFKTRDGYERAVILTIITILTMTNFISNGEKTVKFPFLKEKLSWSLSQYNIFSSISMVIGMGSTVAGVYFLYKMLKIKGSTLCLLGLISSSLGSLLLGITKNNYYVYGAAVISLFEKLVNPLLRTKLGQVVPAEEMGKVFGTVSTVGGLTSLVASFLYTFFYNATLNVNSALFNFISMGICISGAFLAIYLIVLERREPAKCNEDEIENLNTA
ncbi:unnamed protein product [Psylliodes chrysocephalus]|uniref:Proton-coupled folate transporter n=1 Tax=Psylliodes chrysocephalus TaxID=3402493 RepID=A0A9P0G895_9CUCU|nr:unnamed protein product [Psylliodes chrysocephala]